MRKIVIKVFLILSSIPIWAAFECLPSDYPSYEEYQTDWEYRDSEHLYIKIMRPLHQKFKFIPEPFRTTLFLAMYIALCWGLIQLLKKRGCWDVKSINQSEGGAKQNQ
jgi:hypothetical protein